MTFVCGQVEIALLMYGNEIEILKRHQPRTLRIPIPSPFHCRLHHVTLKTAAGSSRKELSPSLSVLTEMWGRFSK
jgi:hypothetical protein